MKNTVIITTAAALFFAPYFFTQIKYLIDKRAKNKHNTRMQANLEKLIESTKGKFFSITFTKKDGSVRIMNAKDKYARLLKGGDNKVAASGYTSFIDRNKDNWACAKASGVVNFKCGNIEETFSV